MSREGRGARFPLTLDQLSDQPRERPPQRPAANTPPSPVGLGLDSEDVRRRMVDRLRATENVCPEVLAAFAAVPRHAFVDAALVTQAYEDTSLPIGHGQTISKPSVVARMLDLLMQGATASANRHLGRVLEIGTGCGYQAAVLAQLAQRVISVERVMALHDRARELLAPIRPAHLRLVYGSIIAAAGGDALPQNWLDQLAIGGRLVAPQFHQGSGHQVLVVVDRTEQGWRQSVHEAVHFVPLKSGLLA